MKINEIGTALSKMTGRTGLVLKAKSPEILLFVGIAGVVGAAVMACRATLKVKDVIANHNDTVEEINDCCRKVEDGIIPAEEYTEDDRKKHLTTTYFHTAFAFVKLYGPAVTLGAASIACIIGGHGIMKKRNVALMAAYKALEEGFNAYRKRVVDELGEEKDYMFKHNLRAEEITETEVGEDGKSKKVKKTQMVSDDPNKLSKYARFFDESCREWSKTPEYNLYFLKAQQNYFNDMLQSRGHVFLNEVYDNLGMERSQAGTIVGWVLGAGDNYIDFGIFDGDRERSRAFVNGRERSILLDFNVDGVIYDLFTKKKA